MLMQDLVLAYRSGHVLITGLLLVLMVALLIFMPREINTHNELILDTTTEGALADLLTEMGMGEGVVYRDEAVLPGGSRTPTEQSRSDFYRQCG
jgi:hypothetical protein